MDESNYKRLSCVDCKSLLEPKRPRGRPRKRCASCAPEQQGYVKGLELVKVCVNAKCGAEFLSRNRKKLACSVACKITAANHKAQMAAIDRGERVCKGCNAVFPDVYGVKSKLYCSEVCRKAYGYKMRPGSTHRRRAKKYGRVYETFSKWDIFARDGWVCQICGVSTPRKLSGTGKPNSPELDHVVALASGGDHVVANVQCACRACNNKKSDGRALGQMGLFSSLLAV